MKRMSDLKKRWSTDQLISGIELPQWLSVLKKNDWQIDPQYLHRMAMVTGLSLPLTLAGRYEDAKFARQISALELNPTPIFVLGHWRSGTTHMHNLIGRVPSHTYSTVHQCVFPGTFLTTDSFLPSLTERLLGDTRTYDNVKQGWYEAAEDEIALAKLTGLSPYIAFMFPDNRAEYERYIDFITVPEDERKRWKEAFIYFVKKIMLQTGGKRVVVKSCAHTARIRIILEMFPDARFIYIHRNPYEVYSSTLHMRSHTDWENFFHAPWDNWEQERERQTLLLGERIFDRYIQDRHLIPEENLVEIAYADLVGNEMKVVGEVWEKLGFGDWEGAEPILTEYVDGLKGYKTNKLHFDDKMKAKVYEAWRQCFDTFGYSKDYPQ